VCLHLGYNSLTRQGSPSSEKFHDLHPADAQGTTEVQGNIVVFIDAAVVDAERLKTGIQSGIDVFLLDPTQDGITQITQALQVRSNLQSIQILSHAKPCSLQLGSAVLNAKPGVADLKYEFFWEVRSLHFSKKFIPDLSHAAERSIWDSTELNHWAPALAASGNLLLHGCNLAARETINESDL
jgi:hypothetical protein